MDKKPKKKPSKPQNRSKTRKPEEPLMASGKFTISTLLRWIPLLKWLLDHFEW